MKYTSVTTVTTTLLNVKIEYRNSKRNSTVKAKHSFLEATQKSRIKKKVWSDLA